MRWSQPSRAFLRDVSETDRFVRLLRRVSSDGILVGAELVGEVSLKQLGSRLRRLLETLTQEARLAGRRMWAPRRKQA